jgi:O-antigen/teichoic acid export membrane protein
MALLLVSFYFVYAKNYYYAAGSFTIGSASFRAFYVTKYLKILYRSNRDFNKLSQINLINAFASFVAIIFVWKYDFYGLCIRGVITALADYYFTWKWKPINVKPIWDKKVFRKLLNVGFPMYGIACVYTLWPVIQRTMILLLGGTKYLGLFALAVIIENSMKTVTNSISSVIYPTMTIAWGKGNSVNSLLKLTVKPVAMTSAMLLIVVPAAWLLLPKAVEIFLPNYVEGIYAAQWMLLVGFIGVFSVFSNIYNVIKQQRDRLISYISGILGWMLSVFVLYHLSGLSLDIFPKAMVIALVIMLIVNLFHIKKYQKVNSFPSDI